MIDLSRAIAVLELLCATPPGVQVLTGFITGTVTVRTLPGEDVSTSIPCEAWLVIQEREVLRDNQSTLVVTLGYVNRDALG